MTNKDKINKKKNVSIAPWPKQELFSSFQDNTKTEQAKTTVECQQSLSTRLLSQG